jgi:radical SAM superfamily enzyme YgiQ (UPF0313 family)
MREIDEAEGTVLIGFQLKELSLGRSVQLARKLKQYRGSKIKLIAGGTYATLAPSDLLGTFDYVVVGSGAGILSILDAEFGGKSIDPIVMAPPTSYEYPLFTDCWVLDDCGEITRGRLRHLVHPQYKNLKPLELMAGSGCSYSCSYCEVASLKTLFGNQYKVRFADPEQVVRLIKREINLDPEIRYIYFFDEDFLLKPTDWIKSFASLYGKSIGLPFFIFVTPFSALRFPDKVETLSRVGLDTINMGIQSGSEKIDRDLFGRKETKDQIRTSVDFLSKLYLEEKITSPPMLDFIISNPCETVDDILETINLIIELPTPFNAIMHCMSFFRGTPLYQKAFNEHRISKKYRFRYDLHDFMSRVRKNEWQLDYARKESVQWLFLNVLLYGMRGMHRVRRDTRCLGGVIEVQLKQYISCLDRVTFDQIISIARALPNPMDDIYFTWEMSSNPISYGYTLLEKNGSGVLSDSTVTA